jgi:hypothetical protein
LLALPQASIGGHALSVDFFSWELSLLRVSESPRNGRKGDASDVWAGWAGRGGAMPRSRCTCGRRL